ncbi:hypothetical protein ACFPMF_02315 [Larkinella bovis]|uniref:Uncharacterized protein n=1 Tax=Larkinella bovis TaxID=683041 RepID=A0ABW0I692_9BACT
MTKNYAVSLVWSDERTGQLYRIDTERKILEVETPAGAWQWMGEVTLKGVDSRDFPPTTRVMGFGKSPQQRYLTIDCTGQVYQFDFRNRTLERLDHTFFRGFNCHSTTFMRNDTLYSFGGYGFWHTNNLITYYRAGKSEWESIPPQTDGPRSLYAGLNGYLPETDSYFSTLNFCHNDAEQAGATTYDFDVYAFSFPNKQWRKLGRVTEAVRERLPQQLDNGVAFFFSGRYFIVSHHASPATKLFLIDPVLNQCRVWEDTHRRFLRQPANTDSDRYQYYIRNDTLHHYLFNGNEATPKGLPQRVAVAQLWQEASPIGAFYTENATDYTTLSLLVLALTATGLAVFYLYHRKNSRVASAEAELPDLSDLTQLEQDLLDGLMRATHSGGLSAEQVNELLQISDKSLDNQRRIRADTIQKLNLKLKYALNLDNGIEKTPSAVDRRMALYVLKEEAARKYTLSSTPKTN